MPDEGEAIVIPGEKETQVAGPGLAWRHRLRDQSAGRLGWERDSDSVINSPRSRVDGEGFRARHIGERDEHEISRRLAVVQVGSAVAVVDGRVNDHRATLDWNRLLEVDLRAPVERVELVSGGNADLSFAVEVGQLDRDVEVGRLAVR